MHEVWQQVWNAVVKPFLQHYAILTPVAVLGFFYGWRPIREPWNRYDGLRRSLRHAIPLFIVLSIIAYGRFDRDNEYREKEVHDAQSKLTQSRDTWLQIIVGDQNAVQMTQLVDASEGLSEVTTRTFDLFKADYSQSELHSLQIFLVAPDRTMEDVVAAGEYRAASTPFARSDSFVGSTIDKGTRYCPNVKEAERDPEHCFPFKPPNPLKLDFASLLCQRLGLAGGQTAFASVCVNSTKAHAFDTNQDAISNSIEKEIGAIAPLLKVFQDARACVMSSHNAKPPTPPNCSNGPALAPHL